MPSQQNRRTFGGLAIVVVLVGLVVILQFQRTAVLTNQKFFFDLATGQTFTADRMAVPPIAAPSGADNGVGIVMFGCGGCDDPASLKQGWLETYTPQAREAMTRLEAATPDTDDSNADIAAIAQGHLIALPPQEGQSPAWVTFDSPEAEGVQSSRLTGLCSDGSRPEKCLPNGS